LYVAFVSGVLGALAASQSWWADSSLIWGGALLTGVTVPAALIAFGQSRRSIPVAVVLTLVPLGLLLAQRVPLSNPREGQIHDATILIDEAARLTLHGDNPYGANYAEVLPPVWHDLGYGPDGELVRNPALDTYAYLPGSFLLDAPFVLVGDALGTGWDARLLFLGTLAAAVVVIGRRPEPELARAGMILGAMGVPTIYYVAWGTNDGAAIALFLLAALLGAQRPRLAGVLLAFALSFKVVLALPALALATLVWRTQGAARLRSWWTCPAVLIATCLPYLIADPRLFVDQTVLFNLNRGSFRFPTLGMGLPAIAGDVFEGPVLAATTVAGLVLAVGGSVWFVWRRPTLPVALTAGGLALLGVFLPATNFRRPYLVLVVALVSGAWLAHRPTDHAPATTKPDPAGR
jgi:hypothetical protein